MAREGHDRHEFRIYTPLHEQSHMPSRTASSDGQIIYDTGLEDGGLNIQGHHGALPLDLTSSWYAGDEKSQFLLPDGLDDDALGRTRKKSISFDTEATLETGAKHSLEDPLPRTASLRSVQSLGRPNIARKTTDRGASKFDPAVCKINPFTGEAIRRRPRRQNTGSTGMSIMDAFIRDPDPEVEQLASLTSDSTASLPREEALTPTSPPGSYISSPVAISSPAFSSAPDSELWPAYRPGSVRSSRTLPSRPISLRRESRRSSRRATSSFSPGSAASAYLAQWGCESATSAAPEPDDEGQSFGLENEYIIGRQIGYGGFSVVKEAFSITPDGEKRKHAVKIVRKNICQKPEADNEKCQQELEREVGIWKYLNHPHILSLHSDYETDFARFCVMDLSEGGSLYDLVRDRRKSVGSNNPILPAALVKSYAFQLACALRYLHEDVRVVHRDVKMENCLIDRPLDHDENPTQPGRLRLCDFGLADFISTDLPYMDGATDDDDDNDNDNNDDDDDSKSPARASNIVGSLEYAAPEALRTEEAVLSPTVDIWAYGVCVFTLVTGDRPFKHAMAQKVIELIEAAGWDEEAVRRSEALAEGEVEYVLELLRGCLQPDRARRWDVARVLASPWFDGCREEEEEEEDKGEEGT